MGELRLEAREFTDLTRWRWELRDAAGRVLAVHDVRLDPSCWQFEAFADLRRYVWWHADPRRRLADEARIVADVGAWIGAEVLGAVAPALLGRGPATVRAVVPEPLLSRPLELAHAGGKPLPEREITLVLQRDRDGAAGAGKPAADPLAAGARPRVLGVFSMPADQLPGPRRERDALAGAVPDARILHYGLTRERLRAVLAEGWDVVCVHGHGVPGGLILQTASGAPDRISAADLTALLDLARDRVRLVTVSASQPAAIITAQQRHDLGIPSPDHRAASHLAADSAPTGTLAARIAERLGCAVLATRYPVTSEFAAAFTAALHPLLAEGLPLPRALSQTLGRLAGTPAFPALSLAAPALFGAAAVDVSLPAPGRAEPGPSRMSGFPPCPRRFAGRAGILARASTVLAPGSGTPGLLLYGVPGAGKTACAVELGYGHQDAFDRLVFCAAGDLADFALALERGLPGFRMVGAVADAKRLARFAPRLTELMARRRVLLVIDGAESLLAADGGWRDPRWGQVIGALSAHAGLGRVIIATGTPPGQAAFRVPECAALQAPECAALQAPECAALQAPEYAALQAEEIGPLSADETLLLARELPRLRALTDSPAAAVDLTASRQLARGVLDAARGIPLLLELADGQAADPRQLAGLAEAAEAAARGDLLAAWTRAVAGTLPLSQRHLFWLLCCLQEADRVRHVVDGMCARLWRLLGNDAEPPGADQALTSLAASALITADGDSYAVHPAIAECGRAQAGPDFGQAVDLEAAMFWDEQFRGAPGPRPALAAVPYLIRQQQWTMAAGLLDGAFAHDQSLATAVATAALARQVAAHEPWARRVLASVLRIIDPAGAESQLRVQLGSALADGDHALAAATAEQLAELCLSGGRPDQALGYAEDAIDHAERAGLDAWSRLRAEVLRLAVRAAQGQHDIALAESYRLRAYLGQPEAREELARLAGADDLASLREAVLATGRAAAVRAGRWHEAVELNAALVQGLRDRDATETDIARARFNDYQPLLRLGQAGAALDVLLTCREIFTQAGDAEGLGKTAGALASVEGASGNREAAARLQRDGLARSYAAGDAPSVAIGYYNLASYAPHHPTVALSLRLASALIFTLAAGAGSVAGSMAEAASVGGAGSVAGAGSVGGAGSAEAGDAGDAVRRAAEDLREFGAIPPADVADLCGIIGDVPGTTPGRLITRLAGGTDIAERVLRALIARAQELASPPGGDDLRPGLRASTAATGSTCALA